MTEETNVYENKKKKWSGQCTARACLKKAFRELRVPVCGRFYPNEGGVAGYGNRMRVKYTAKWGLQIAEMIFQTRSRARDLRSVSYLFLVSVWGRYQLGLQR